MCSQEYTQNQVVNCPQALSNGSGALQGLVTGGAFSCYSQALSPKDIPPQQHICSLEQRKKQHQPQVSYFLSIKSRIPPHRMVPHTLRVVLLFLFKPFWNYLHRPSQRCVFQMIVHSIKLAVKINHFHSCLLYSSILYSIFLLKTIATAIKTTSFSCSHLSQFLCHCYFSFGCPLYHNCISLYLLFIF